MDETRWPVTAVTIVWAAVIIATAVVLKGTPYWPQLLPIVGGGAAATLVLLGAQRRRRGSR
ncbi:MAG: hypothetical protein N2508_08995 [Anaerolineae bacterium]|nr:hypothetical protein [Anaerolineae bacterium]